MAAALLPRAHHHRKSRSVAPPCCALLRPRRLAWRCHGPMSRSARCAKEPDCDACSHRAQAPAASSDRLARRPPAIHLGSGRGLKKKSLKKEVDRPTGSFPCLRDSFTQPPPVGSSRAAHLPARGWAGRPVMPNSGLTHGSSGLAKEGGVMIRSARRSRAAQVAGPRLGIATVQALVGALVDVARGRVARMALAECDEVPDEASV
jgi:hypothetical protein